MRKIKKVLILLAAPIMDDYQTIAVCSKCMLWDFHFNIFLCSPQPEVFTCGPFYCMDRLANTFCKISRMTPSLHTRKILAQMLIGELPCKNRLKRMQRRAAVWNLLGQVHQKNNWGKSTLLYQKKKACTSSKGPSTLEAEKYSFHLSQTSSSKNKPWSSKLAKSGSKPSPLWDVGDNYQPSLAF